MAIVFSTHPLHPSAAALLAGKATLEVATATDGPTLLREGADADIVIVRAPLPEAMFGQGRRLRAAIRHGAGLDMIPIGAATAAGVLVANVPGVNARSVAEYVLFAALALARRFRAIDRDLRTRGWEAGRAHAPTAGELYGRTLGLVGVGHVGRAVAAIAGDGFGMTIVGHARNADRLPLNVEYRPLDALLAESDVVVLACPLTEETRGLIDARRIALLKPGALLVNVARGAVVDEAALIAALAAGRIGGAAVDVFTTQPLPPGSPWLALDEAVLTPHLAGITEESMARMGVGAVEEALRVLAGGLPANLVNPEATALYGRRFGVAV